MALEFIELWLYFLVLQLQHISFVSIFDNTSYCKISWSVKSARLAFRHVRSLWNLPMCCQNSKRHDNLYYQSCGVETSGDLTIRRRIRYLNGVLIDPCSCRHIFVGRKWGRLSESHEMKRSYPFDKWRMWLVISNQTQMFCTILCYDLWCCGHIDSHLWKYDTHIPKGCFIETMTIYAWTMDLLYNIFTHQTIYNQQRCSGFSNWLCLRCLRPWVNCVSSVCWSTIRFIF